MTESSNNNIDELLTKSTGVLIKTTLVDFPGKVASAYFLRGCNLRCPYCYNVELVKGILIDTQVEESNQQFVSPVQVLEHLFNRKNVMNGLVISGGEPLLNPVTPELIKRAKKMGYSVKLDTNGTLPLLLEKLLSDPETRPDFIAMDFKTSPSRYNAEIKPVANFVHADFNELINASIALIQTLGNENYEIRTVLVPGLVGKTDIKNMASIIPQDASWQFAQFRNENCIDPAYNEVTPYTDAQLKELVDLAKTLIPASALR